MRWAGQDCRKGNNPAAGPYLLFFFCMRGSRSAARALKINLQWTTRYSEQCLAKCKEKKTVKDREQMIMKGVMLRSEQ